MAVVTKTTYETLAGYIGDAYSAQVSAAPYIASGLSEVLGLDDADQEYDMLASFYELDATLEGTLSNTSNYTNVARTLQRHVELRTGSTIAQFLTDNSITVSSGFATVSKAAGFDVDSYQA